MLCQLTLDYRHLFLSALKTKAVSARIDQMQKKVMVRSTTHRTFGKHHWQLISQHLADWEANLGSVESNLRSLATIQQQQQQQLVQQPAQ